MDSLGGILIKGLLGNPILAKFNLFFEIVIEEITPTPTPTITPTPTPIQVNIGGGSSTYAKDEHEEKRTVKIVIRYKSREWVSIHTVTDKILRVTINTITVLNKVKKKVIDISLKLANKGPTKVKVKLHDD